MALQRIINNKYGLIGSEVWYDTETDQMVINQTQDVEQTLKDNKAKYNAAQGYKSEVFNEVADIPLVIVQQWLKEGLNIFDNSPETEKKLRKKLNSNEYRHLRTRPGRL